MARTVRDLARDHPAVVAAEVVRSVQAHLGLAGAYGERAAGGDGLPVLRQPHLVVPLRQRLEALDHDAQRPVAVLVELPEIERGGRVLRETGRVHRDRPQRREALALPAGKEAPEEREQRDRRCEREQRAGAAARQLDRNLLLGRVRLGQRGRELGRWAGLDQQLVHALEPRALLGREVLAHELAEVGLSRHSSSPSRRSAMRASAARVRVLTVPSGIPRYSATSDCERPPQ